MSTVYFAPIWKTRGLNGFLLLPLTPRHASSPPLNMTKITKSCVVGNFKQKSLFDLAIKEPASEKKY